ncbi:MAG: DUF115 domain-containing protein [Treponema sp.]|nr:DUF115 domain-containing protein [Treponema sp.]
MNKLYQSIIEAKNGTFIPLLYNGKTVDSKYNPQREAEKQLENINTDNQFNFFILLGLGCGIFAQALSQKYPDSRILIIERSQEDINFLLQIKLIQELKENSKIRITGIEDLRNVFTSFWLPAKYEKPEIIENHAWILENNDQKEIIQNELNKAFRIISADYSVQSHFGKIWQHNILSNLMEFSDYLQNNEDSSLINSLNRKKKAIIIAAGPSLDKKIEYLKENKDSFFIIATDTAAKALYNNKIKAHAVISIDGQPVSVNHFLASVEKDALYFFDFSANSSAAQYIRKQGGRLVYFSSGHPLLILASTLTKCSFPQLFSGAGTVTIAATDLAIKLGFTEIEVLGADFSYPYGKAYTKGTYLEDLYYFNQNKIDSCESKFDKLMFRTALNINKNNKPTTEILEAYQVSFIEFLKSNDIKYRIENEIYILSNSQNKREELKVCKSFDFKTFLNLFKQCKLEDIEIALLPYIAYLKKEERGPVNYQELLKLAQTFIVSYNERYEK